MAYDFGAKKLLTYDDQQKFIKSLDKDPKFKNFLLEQYHGWLNDPKNKDIFGDDDTEIAANKAFIDKQVYDMLYGENVSARDKAMENGFTQEDFNNMRKAWEEKLTLKKIDSLSTLREDNGNTSISDAEKVIQSAQEGKLFTRYVVPTLSKLVHNPYESIDKLRQETADYLYGGTDGLNKDQKRMIDATVALGAIHREANRLFSLEVKEPNAVHGIDVATGLPTFTVYDTDSNGDRYVKQIYRLGYNPEEKEEQWQVYKNGDWIPDPTKPIPNLRKTGTVKAIINDIGSAFKRGKEIIGSDVREPDKPSAGMLYGVDMNALWKYANGGE